VSEYVAQVADGAFARSFELFSSIVAELEGTVAGACTHAALEERLGECSRELMRQLYQDHADVRAVREERRDDVAGAGGTARSRVEKGHRRTLVTVFGPVVITRMAYRAPGEGNLYPADAVWNLPAGRHSDGLARLAVIESVRGSFDTAAEAVTRATGQTVGKPQMLGLAHRSAADVAGFYAGRRPGPSPDSDVLVMTDDGKGINMRHEALRDATRKAAASCTARLTARLSPGEKSCRKRMAELGCVYDITPAPRSAADVLPGRGPGPRPERRPGPRARGRWLTASVTDDIPAVIAATFDEADRRDPRHSRTWIALVDGNKTQIEAITAEAARRDVPVTILIDVVHVLEYLWGAAWSFFDHGDPAAEAWVFAQAAKILEGKAGQVATGIRRRATRFGYSAAERKGADEAARYLTSKKPYLGYDTALAAGWPIATGVIEGACRHLVKDRFDVTGARWGLDGAEAILTLRALVINGDFEDYWRYHLVKEHQRRHETRYARHQASHTLAA